MASRLTSTAAEHAVLTDPSVASRLAVQASLGRDSRRVISVPGEPQRSRGGPAGPRGRRGRRGSRC